MGQYLIIVIALQGESQMISKKGLRAIIEDELRSNIFLRCDQNDLKIKLNMENHEDYKVFRKVRDLKDNF